MLNGIQHLIIKKQAILNDELDDGSDDNIFEKRDKINYDLESCFMQLEQEQSYFSSIPEYFKVKTIALENDIFNQNHASDIENLETTFKDLFAKIEKVLLNKK